MCFFRIEDGVPSTETSANGHLLAATTTKTKAKATTTTTTTTTTIMVDDYRAGGCGGHAGGEDRDCGGLFMF